VIRKPTAEDISYMNLLSLSMPISTLSSFNSSLSRTAISTHLQMGGMPRGQSPIFSDRSLINGCSGAALEVFPMTVYLVEMWPPKEGLEKECLEASRRVLEYIRNHRAEFRERKSERLFRAFIGGRSWFIEIQRYEDSKSMEELDEKIAKNKEYIELVKEWKKCVDPRDQEGSCSSICIEIYG